ncbi:FMN-binding protein [Corynebacterium glyciniphilum]|uniref:FMN-binding protein n=1 Tax=Corynebacterium glyciniphilum TaxID=1404244 RepID=UPI003DA01A9B
MKPHIVTRAAFGAAASLAAVAPLAGCNSDGEPTTSSTSSSQDVSAQSPDMTSPSAETADSTAEYTDGTYTARGVYGGAPSYMDFTVTIEDDVITDVESELMEDNNDTSRGYQERFAAALPDEVVGESIDDVEVGVLAGASSCGDGFNDAVAQIRDEARVD